LAVLNAYDVDDYFELIVESGQTKHIATLFARIAQMRYTADKRKAMDECFNRFNDFVLPNSNVVGMLAPFFDEYVVFSYNYIVRCNPEILNSVLKLAYHLHLSDEQIKKGDAIAALEHFKAALAADERFLPLVQRRFVAFASL
jgi:hypothetical protein